VSVLLLSELDLLAAPNTRERHIRQDRHDANCDTADRRCEGYSVHGCPA
jgi:hypothetical protein